VGTMMVRHTVPASAAWKTGFDTHRSAREAAGMMQGRVYRSVEAPNEIVVISEITTRRRPEAFASSHFVKSDERLGVIGIPELY